LKFKVRSGKVLLAKFSKSEGSQTIQHTQ